MSLTLDALDAFLGKPPGEDAATLPYLDAAAVLAAFDPLALRPHGPAAADGVVDRLLPRCEPVAAAGERGLWTLAPAERRAALIRLGTPAAMAQALQANPDRVQSPVQQMFERVVEGRPIVLPDLTREELAAAIAVREWLGGTPLEPALPDPAELRRALARQDLVAPMRRLVAGGFVNRVEELTQLSAFVSAGPAQAPLFLHGPGGVGKSTLLARFLLDQLQRSDIAIAYLDIDRPTLYPEQPLTLLLELLAQLRMQLELSPRAAGLSEQIAEMLGRVESMRQMESPGLPEDDLFLQLSGLLGELPAPVTVIVVVDTFEEAHFLGPDVVWPLTDFLVRLTEVVLSARVVISGRTLPAEFTERALRSLVSVPPVLEPIDLAVLDPGSARELLATGLARAGLPALTDAELDDVVGVVSSNPMCLKLAVRLLRDEGVEKLRSMRSQVLARLKAEKVQALLYGRILHHIHTEDVKRIAYPGLIVRRITPEVIRQVLAGPCALELTPERDEHGIYWDLQREAALVEVDDADGSLRHRADVRKAMLGDLTDHVEPEVVAAIDAAAVAYYEVQDGPIARAEELYHRMRRGDSEGLLEQRWLPGAGGRLKSAGDEVPAQQRLWLAGKLGATLDPSVREAASQEAWEATAALAADRYLQSRYADEALAVLHEREQRLPRSALFSLESEAYRFLDRPDDALRVARAGVESATGDGAIDMALELLLKMVNIEEGRAGLEAAAALADEAAAIARHSVTELLRLRTTVTELRVHRRRFPDDHNGRAELRAEALALLTPEVWHQLRSRSVLLREVAAELAKEDAQIASTAFETLGVELATDTQAELLGRALASIQHATDDAQALSPALAHAVEAIEESGYDPVLVKEWSLGRTSGRDARDIGKAVAQSAPGGVVLEEMRDYFRAGVDHSIGLA